MRDSGCLQPIVNCLLNPSGNWHGPDVPCFSDQVDDGPMIFAKLEVLNSQFSQFSPSQTAPQQNCQDRSIPLSL
jgi:hypothetical protein